MWLQGAASVVLLLIHGFPSSNKICTLVSIYIQLVSLVNWPSWLWCRPLGCPDRDLYPVYRDIKIWYGFSWKLNLLIRIQVGNKFVLPGEFISLVYVWYNFVYVSNDYFIVSAWISDQVRTEPGLRLWWYCITSSHRFGEFLCSAFMMPGNKGSRFIIRDQSRHVCGLCGLDESLCIPVFIEANSAPAYKLYNMRCVVLSIV